MIEQKGENMSENQFVAQINKGLYRNQKVKGSFPVISEMKEKDQEMIDNINKLKNQILYNNKENEI